MNLFHSARLKLTAFYFAILVVFCLMLTVGIRAFAKYEFDRANDAQRQFVVNLYKPVIQFSPGSPNQDFAQEQGKQSALTSAHLNRDVVVVDVIALVAGAFVSYWYAGRTLKPIEEAHEEQKRFASDASHELRTPLASMRLENEVFLRQKKFSEAEARIQLASNLEEVDRLERLAGNLLALNQYEHTRLPRKPVNVTAVGDEAIERTKRAKDAAKTAFRNELPKGKVLGEQESLTELICILLDNAVKYGPKGGEITLGGYKTEDYYVLQVRDHGPGIAEKDLPHIFDRLYRGDKARSGKVSGHGIGLSLAQQIARANGGYVEAANHPDGGAVFSVVLDLARS